MVKRYTCACGAYIEGTDITLDSFWFKLHEPHEPSWLEDDNPTPRDTSKQSGGNAKTNHAILPPARRTL